MIARQLYVQRTSEGLTVMGPESEKEATLVLHREEVKAYGSVLHAPMRMRFQEDSEEAKNRAMTHPT